MALMEWVQTTKPMRGVLVVTVAIFLSGTIEQASARFGGGGFGGFHGGGGFGGFHGGGGYGGGGFGGSRFGDGGLYDHSADAGFGRGGWGSVQHGDDFNSRANSFQSNHTEFNGDAQQLQQNRFN